MRLSELLKPDYVKIGLEAKTKEDIINEIATFLTATHKSIDKKEAVRAILEREKKGSTGLANGLAIPHGRSPKVEGINLVAVYSPEGKDFDSYDKKPSRLFICVLSSDEYSPHEQLEVLRIIAEIYEKTNIAKELQNISTSIELYDLLIKSEREIHKL